MQSRQVFLSFLMVGFLLPQVSFASFSIVEDSLDQEQHTLIGEGFEPIIGELLVFSTTNPVVDPVEPDPEPEEPAPSVGSGSSGGGRGRHHVASWFLAKKYEELTGRAYEGGDLTNIARESEEPRYKEEWHTAADDIPTPEEEITPAEDTNTIAKETTPEPNEEVASEEDTNTVAKEITPVEQEIEETIANNEPIETEEPDTVLSKTVDPYDSETDYPQCSKMILECDLLKNKDVGLVNLNEQSSRGQKISILEKQANRNYIMILLLGVMQFGILIMIWIYTNCKDNKKKKPRTRFHKKTSRRKNILMILIILFGVGFSLSAQAEDGALRYQGRIKDDQGGYAIGDYTFRFSMWQNPNTTAGDVSNGEININATHYLGWQEEKTLALVADDDGLFLFFLGSTSPLPEDLFTGNNHVYLHVDVKTTGQPDSTYEQIDASIDTAKTRRSFSPVPYAKNADKLDSRHVGFDPGNIPYVNENTGLLPENIIPGGTNLNTFTLDNNGDAAATDTLALQFGSTLAKTLSWNGMLEQFEFNDTVSITGDLVVSGTINNVTFGPKSFIETLTPEYPNSIFVGDGTDNNGSMHEETESESGTVYQMLRWATIQPSLQDYGVQVKYTLPTDFIAFEDTNQIALMYKTDDTVLDSKVDLTLQKNGALGVDQLETAGIALSGNTWTTTEFTLKDQTTWAAGDTLIFYVNLMASQTGDARVSNLEIRYKTD